MSVGSRAAAIVLLIASSAVASELTVDKRTLALDDSVTITVSLQDAFASADVGTIPLRNLAVDGLPSVANSFQWINGTMSRQKIVRFIAHPLGAGEAIVGPLVLHGDGGRVETLPAITLQVMPDVTAQLTDPAAIARELIATGRDPIFVVAEADRKSVFAGEEVVVTWTLYNATDVQQYGMSEQPRLDDFWSEELRVADAQPERIRVGGIVMQRLPIRRVALFPLRSGTLTVPPLGLAAAIVKRTESRNPFGEFEGTVVELRRRSAPLVIDVRPIPPGPPVDVVGNVDMLCGSPAQESGGPVAINVTVKGRANLRSLAPPRFTKPVDGTMQIAEGRTTVDSAAGDATMTRTWRLLIFPSRSGFITIPPLTLRTLTATGERRDITCEQRLAEVTRAGAEPPPPITVKKSLVATVRQAWIPAAVAALLVIALGIAVPRIEKTRRIHREVGQILHISDADITASVEEWLRGKNIDPVALLREASDRGDAYRAVRSLADERIGANESELRRRVRELVSAISR